MPDSQPDAPEDTAALQAENRQLRADLEHCRREFDEFARIVSHDFKAPIRGVTTLAGWVVEQCSPVVSEDARENLELILERARYMSQLVDGALVFTRAGRAPPFIEALDTGELVQEVIAALAPSPELRVRVEGELPEVAGDRARLLMVFQQLISNAIVHHGEGPGEVVVSCRDLGSTWEFAVRDDGPGIDAKQLERIFKIFQTLQPEAERKGPGVGLPVARKLVELDGGSLSVDSTPGRGSTFRFSVPRRPAQGG